MVENDRTCVEPTDEDKERAYQSAIQLYSVETQAQWQLRTAFLLVHTIWLGFLLNAIVSPGKLQSSQLLLAGAALIGFIFSGLSLITDTRMAKTSMFRMLLAKRLEKQGWWLLQGPIEELTDDGCVTKKEYQVALKAVGAKDRDLKMKWYSKYSGREVMTCVFVLFALIYLFLFVWMLKGRLCV